LAQTDECGAPAKFLHGNEKSSKIIVDAEKACLRRGRLALQQQDSPHPVREEPLHKAVTGCQIGQHWSMERERGDEDDGESSPACELMNPRSGQVEQGLPRRRPSGFQWASVRMARAEEFLE